MDSSERISAYCIDLVDLANKGLIEEITERDNETNQAINILCTGDNPCFVGESGVGKSAIVQNLALKIAKGEVPEKLKDKKIWLLDFSKLMASGNSSEDYITKIRNLVGKLKNNRDNILFFDEVQRIAPIADYFKTEMAKGSSEGGITIIGATTPNEYNSTIAKDPALVRRFSLIKVTESSKEETKKILNGVKQSVSEEFGVVVKDECIDEIIRLSEKYKKSDYFPAKAIKLLNQTASFCKNSNKNVVNKQSVMEYMSMSLNIPVEEMAKD